MSDVLLKLARERLDRSGRILETVVNHPQIRSAMEEMLGALKLLAEHQAQQSTKKGEP